MVLELFVQFVLCSTIIFGNKIKVPNIFSELYWKILFRYFSVLPTFSGTIDIFRNYRFFFRNFRFFFWNYRIFSELPIFFSVLPIFFELPIFKIKITDIICKPKIPVFFGSTVII